MVAMALWPHLTGNILERAIIASGKTDTLHDGVVYIYIYACLSCTSGAAMALSFDFFFFSSFLEPEHSCLTCLPASVYIYIYIYSFFNFSLS